MPDGKDDDRKRGREFFALKITAYRITIRNIR